MPGSCAAPIWAVGGCACQSVGYDESFHTATDSNTNDRHEKEQTYTRRARSRLHASSAGHGTVTGQTRNDGVRHSVTDRRMRADASAHLESPAYSEIRSGNSLFSGQVDEPTGNRRRRHGLVERAASCLRTATAIRERELTFLAMGGLPRRDNVRINKLRPYQLPVVPKLPTCHKTISSSLQLSCIGRTWLAAFPLACPLVNLGCAACTDFFSELLGSLRTRAGKVVA